MLRRLFDAFMGNGPPTLTDLAKRDDLSEFARRFVREEFVILCLPLGAEGGLDVSTASEDALLAMTEKAARAVTSSGHGDVVWLERDGERLLPLFTSKQASEALVGHYSRETDHMHAFGVVAVGLAGILQRREEAGARSFILNAFSPDEMVLFPRHLAAIAKETSRLAAEATGGP
jgi:SseB protein N-terminal domain